MKKIAIVFISVLLLAGCSSKSTQIELDENAAIQVGNTFLQEIMAGNYQQAYDRYISDGAKYNPAMKIDRFVADFNAITEKYGAMQKAVFDAYQLVPGRKVMQLYYNMTHAQAGVVSYHLVLELDNKGVFKVFLIDVGNGQVYPPNSQQAEPKLKIALPVEVLPATAQ